MSIGYNPKIVTDGLLACYDASNPKSYNPNLVTTLGSVNCPFNNQSIATQSDVAPTGVSLSCKHDLTGASGPYMNVRVDRTLPVGTYTISAWVKGTTSFNANFCYIGETPGTSGATSTTISVTTSWKRFTNTFTITTQQTAGRVQIFFGTEGNDKIISVFGVELVAGSTSSFNYIDNNSRGINWTELTGNSNSAITGVPAYNSSGNGSITFNGSTQEAQLLNTNYPTNAIDPFSVETAIYIPSAATWTNTYYGNILTRGSYAGSHGLWRHSTNNILSMYVRQNNPYAATEALATITRDTWYHVIGTWDGYYPKIYINGSLVSTGNLMASTTTYTSDYWVVGAVKAAGGADGNRFQGNIANAKIYNKALTANEVLQNFNAIRGRFGL